MTARTCDAHAFFNRALRLSVGVVICVFSRALAQDVAPAGDWMDPLIHLFHPGARMSKVSVEERERQLQQEELTLTSRQGGRAGFHSEWASHEDAEKWVEIDLGRELFFDSMALCSPVIPVNQGWRRDFGMPRRFRIEARGEAGPSRVLIDHTERDLPAANGLPYHARVPRQSARYLRLIVTKLSAHQGRFALALSEWMVFDGDAPVAARQAMRHHLVTVSDSLPPSFTWQPSYIIDGSSTLGVPLASGSFDEAGRCFCGEATEQQPAVIQLTLKEATTVESMTLIPAWQQVLGMRPGECFPRRLKVELLMEKDGPPVAAFENTNADAFGNLSLNPVEIRLGPSQARYVRVSVLQASLREKKPHFGISEIQVWAGGKNVALEASMEASLGTKDEIASLIDGRCMGTPLLSWPVYLNSLSEMRERAAELTDLKLAASAAYPRWRDETLLAGAAISGLALCGVFSMQALVRRRRRRELEAMHRALARDLHDDIGSHLAAIALSGGYGATQNLDQETGRARFRDIALMAQETAESMRDIVGLLAAQGQGHHAIGELVRRMAERLLLGHRLEFTWDEKLLPVTWTKRDHRELLLFCREAMHNIQRHAQATSVLLALAPAEAQGLARLTVEDDGVGLGDAAPSNSGFGIANLHQRAAALNATLAFSNISPHGTRITLIWRIK
jgi:signal transduction histidine kinase